MIPADWKARNTPVARPWFKQRESGLGWTPISWEGWLVSLGSMGVFVAVNLLFVAGLIGRR
jgi:hypothetical protein